MLDQEGVRQARSRRKQSKHWHLSAHGRPLLRRLPTHRGAGTPTLGPTLAGSLAPAPWPAPQCHGRQKSGAGRGRPGCPGPPRWLPPGCPPGGRERGPSTQTPCRCDTAQPVKVVLSWHIVIFFISLKKLQMVTTAMKLKTLTPWKESYDHPRQHIKKQRHDFTNKGPSS